MTLTTVDTDQDCYFSDDIPTTNLNGQSVQVGEYNGGASVRRTVIRADLSSIAAGQSISACNLKLTVTGDLCNNARTMSAYRLLRNWVEGEVTWNVYSTGNNWGTAGATNATDIDTTPVGTKAIGASETPLAVISIPISAAVVQSWLDGDYSNYGVLLKLDTESDDLHYYYDTESVTSSYRPVWDITHADSTNTAQII